MNWLDEVRSRQKRGNRILFSKDCVFLQELEALFCEQNHRIMVLWALDFAAQSAARLEEKYPGQARPGFALDAAREWAAGKIRMREAQRKILDCHAFAKELEDPEGIALCHAVGQACSVVHTAGHAMGYPIYDLSAIVYRLGVEQCAQAVEARMQAYEQRLLYWRAHEREYQDGFADFLRK